MLYANTGAGPRETVAATHPMRPDAIRAPWLDLVQPSEDERALAERASGLRIPTEAELAEIETSSRAYQEGDVLYLSTPMSYRDARGISRVAPLGFVLSPGVLVTIRFAELPGIESFAGRFGAGHQESDAAGAFVGLVEALVDRMADVLEQLGADLDAVSQRVFHPDPASGPAVRDARLRGTLGQVGRIGDSLSNLRDSLLGVMRIVQYVPETAKPWLPKAHQPKFRAIRQDLQSLGEYDQQLANKVQFLLDATLGFINIEQNNSIKVLTVVSIVGVPPTLVASIYGMNFQNMPELHWAWGYQYGMAMIVLSAVVPLLLFRWKGWI